MAKAALQRRRGMAHTEIDLVAALAGIVAMNVEQLRDLWRRQRGQEPPAAFSKDLIARALAYQLQVEVFGGPSPRLRRLLAASASAGQPARRVKVGAIIVRDRRGSVKAGFPDAEEFSSLCSASREMGAPWHRRGLAGHTCGTN